MDELLVDTMNFDIIFTSKMKKTVEITRLGRGVSQVLDGARTCLHFLAVGSDHVESKNSVG